MNILHLDENHPLLIQQLNDLGFTNKPAFHLPKDEVEAMIDQYDGLIIRSRFRIDEAFINRATRLKFIARVGAGLENIDTDHAARKGITLIAAPEGNRNAVGEHALGMLLSLFNKLNKADAEVRAGKWLREANRGLELDGKTVGLIGYGNMGKAFAKKLRGFDCTVLCHDIKPDVGDAHAKQVPLAVLQAEVDVLSLHTPQTEQTIGMIDAAFIQGFTKPFWLINTARGSAVVTRDLVQALKTGRVLGAGLDVLEYEKSSFEQLFADDNMPEAFQYLIRANNVLLSPHVAGWSIESHEKLAQVIVDKIKANFAP